MPHALVVYNPVSGSKNMRNVPRNVELALRKYHYTFQWFTTVPGSRQPLEQFMQSSFDRIIVIGGDGTVAQVARFLTSHALSIPIAIIAQGSGNLLATALGIPIRPLHRAITFALTGHPAPLDCMNINHAHTALIAAGQGYDVFHMQNTSRASKRAWGVIAYVFSFLKTFFTYREHAYQIIIDGTSIHTRAKSVMVVNMWQINNIPLYKSIVPTDGLLNVVALNPRTLLDAFSLLIRIVLHRHRPPSPRFQVWQGTHIKIKQEHATHIQIDGEVIEEPSLDITVQPRAISFIYPRQKSPASPVL